MNRTNPLFSEDENPVDALHRIGYFLRFLRELQGNDRDELDFTVHGKEGFRFFLKFLEDMIRQIAEAIEKEKNLNVVEETEAITG